MNNSGILTTDKQSDFAPGEKMAEVSGWIYPFDYLYIHYFLAAIAIYYATNPYHPPIHPAPCHPAPFNCYPFQSLAAMRLMFEVNTIGQVHVLQYGANL